MDEDAIIRENWEEIKKKVQEESGQSKISYETWIKPLMFYHLEENVVYIAIPSSPEGHLQLDYISKKYTNFFKVAISEMLGREFRISFLLEKDISTDLPKEEIPATQKPVAEIASENDGLNPKYNFDSFVVGSNNRLAHSACLAVAENPGEVYNPLYIYGGSGLGKTHLMHSIGHFILEHNSKMKVLYVTSEVFTNEVIESIRSGNATSMAKLREKYRTVDVLMIDDIQFIIGKESTQEEFFHTFNALHEAHKQIILSSDKPPKEIQTLDERFSSRFIGGLTVDVSAPDYETRVAILRKNAESMNISISDEITDYIANNIKSNIRELEGAFNKILAFARLNKNSPLDLNLAQEALKDMVYSSKSSSITAETISKVVAEEYQIRVEDIYSQKRNAEYVLARQVVMYLCSDLLDMNYSRIGKTLGRDHSTIMHGIDKIKEDLSTNEDLSRRIDSIRKKLTGNNRP